MRVSMLSCLLLLLLRCGEDDPEPVSAAPPAVSAPPERSEAPRPPPPAVLAPPIESCEGLARACGGWTGCIHVRERRDPDGTLHYDGLDELAGHSYAPDARCAAGETCDEMCDPASGLCRPGVLEEIPEVCSRSGGPSRASFYCEFIDAGCVRHDLPPPSVHAGGRS